MVPGGSDQQYSEAIREGNGFGVSQSSMQAANAELQQVISKMASTATGEDSQLFRNIVLMGMRVVRQ